MAELVVKKCYLLLHRAYFRPTEALVHRGINRMEMQDLAGAIADFEAAIQSEQTIEAASETTSRFYLAQAFFYRGKVSQHKGEQTAALSDWAEAISCCSTYSQPYYDRAIILISKGDFNQALCDLNSAIEAEPAMAIAYFQRGNVRFRLGDTAGAKTDWQYAVCNDFTLTNARQNLEKLQQNADDLQLSQTLAAPLAEKGLTAKVQYKGDRLEIHVHRAVGTGVNYYALPDLIRQYLIPLQLSDVTHFQLIGSVGDVKRPDWNQSCALYKGQSCPPSNWQSAISTIFLFPPLAVPALIQSASVKRAYKKGKYIEALDASRLAKVFGAMSTIPLSFLLFLSFGYAAYIDEKEQSTLIAVDRLEETTKKTINWPC